MRIKTSLLLMAMALLASCNMETKQLEGESDIQAVSLLGKPLRPAAMPEERLEKLEQQLADAREAFEKSPDNEEALIWFGRRTAYLGLKKEAIEIYTLGIARHPESAKIYRHRGHQYIGIREFEKAIADLEFAAELIAGTQDEIEPDGMPNARNIPTSTLHSNIWYHLGLALYLTGDFERAVEAYRSCMKVSKNPDMQVATSNWLYMTFRRLGREADAARVLEPIHADMDIIENGSYHQLLLMYKGERDPSSLLDTGADAIDNASAGYGVGNWYLYNGSVDQACEVFEGIVNSGQWAAFGYIAAEADLSRMPN